MSDKTLHSIPIVEEQLEGDAHSIIGGAMSLTFCNLIAQVINYGIHIGLGRFFVPGVYGYFGIIVSTLHLLETTLRWGLSKTISYYVVSDKGSAKLVLKNAFQLQTVYALILFFVFFSLSNPLATVLGDPGLISYFRASAPFILAFAFVPVYAGYLSGIGSFGNLGALSVIRSFATLLFITVFLGYGFEIYGVIGAYTASGLTATGYSMWVSRGSSSMSNEHVTKKHLIAFGFPLFLSSLAASFLMRMDLFLIQSLLSDRTLTGLYASANALIKAPYFLSLGAGLVVFRTITKLRTKKRSEIRAFTSATFYYYVLGLAPIPFMVSASAEELLLLAFGREYMLAAPALKVLSFCFVFMILQDVLANIIVGLGHPRWSMALRLGLVPVQASLIYLWVLKTGLVGVALATTLSWALGTVIGMVYLMRQGYLSLPNWKSIGRIAIGCLSAYWLVLWGTPSGIWLLPFLLLGYVLYLGLLRFVGEFSSGDLNLILEGLYPAKKLGRSA